MSLTASNTFTPKAMGYDLDTRSSHFGQLRSSAAERDDMDTLRIRMEEDGYVFIPGFWEREEVEPVRAFYLRQLVEEGGVIDESRPIDEAVAQRGFHGKKMNRGDLAKANPHLRKHLFSGKIIEFFSRFLGGPCTHFDYVWLRSVAPQTTSTPHTDIVYMGRGTRNLFTAWVPYSDIDQRMGGLIVLEHSHHLRETRLKHYVNRDTDTYCVNRPYAREYLVGTKRWRGNLSNNPVSLREKLGGRWLTSEYAMGDMLFFNMFLVHGSLQNQTDRVRLSSDSRYQLASEPIDHRWIGDNPVGHKQAGKFGRVC